MARREAEFDPYLGLACARTWWDLGKHMSRRHSPDLLAKSIKTIHRDLDAEQKAIVDVKSLAAFLDGAYTLLAAKFVSEPIAALLQAKIAAGSKRRFSDSGRFLKVDEPFDAFWAMEFELLFLDLDVPLEGHPDGWLNAVNKCHECGAFFVKQRKDQLFDTAKCRITFSNRDAYMAAKRSRKSRH